MMPLDLLRVCAPLLVAVACGLAFAPVLQVPAKLGYPVPQYIELQTSLYVEWGPAQIGGFLEPLVIGATGMLALLWEQKLAFQFPLAGFVALLIAFPLVFLLLVCATANAAFRGSSLFGVGRRVGARSPVMRVAYSGRSIRPARPAVEMAGGGKRMPPSARPTLPTPNSEEAFSCGHWADLRNNCELGHALRFGLQFVAVAALVLCVVFDAGKTGAAAGRLGLS